MERKNKKKLLGSLARIFFAFMFISSWAVLGVALAISSAKVEMQGQISFSATDVQVTVSDATFTNFKSTPSDKCKGFTLNAANTTEPDTTSWAGLSLNFKDNGSDATIEYTITNDDLNGDSITITFGEITGSTGTNATMEVKATNDTAAAETVPVAGKAYTLAATKTLKVTVTFKVTDKNKSATITSWKVPVTMAKA